MGDPGSGVYRGTAGQRWTRETGPGAPDPSDVGDRAPMSPEGDVNLVSVVGPGHTHPGAEGRSRRRCTGGKNTGRTGVEHTDIPARVRAGAFPTRKNANSRILVVGEE